MLTVVDSVKHSNTCYPAGHTTHHCACTALRHERGQTQMQLQQSFLAVPSPTSTASALGCTLQQPNTAQQGALLSASCPPLSGTESRRCILPTTPQHAPSRPSTSYEHIHMHAHSAANQPQDCDLLCLSALASPKVPPACTSIHASQLTSTNTPPCN